MKARIFSIFFATLTSYQLSYSQEDYTIISQKDIQSSSSYMEPTAQGGGIDTTEELNIANYQSVLIKNNTAVADKGIRAGGGMSNSLKANGYAYGGGIYSSNSLSFQDNTYIEITGNYAQATTSVKTSRPYSAEAYSYAAGGALYHTSNLNLCNNGNVHISQNFAEASSYAAATGSTTASGVKFGSSAKGGAIYSQESINISGNTNVVFERNYEKTKEGNDAAQYRLRSIYSEGKGNVNLSAVTGGKIEIKDSVYIEKDEADSVILNADYKDSNGTYKKAAGEIILSGKDTEEHLKEVKGGIAGTTTEIENSRYSEIRNNITIHGGTFSVEDKAILRTHDINISEDSCATLKVLDAEIYASAYNVNINQTGQLTLGGTDGTAKLTALNVNINKNAALTVKNTATAGSVTPAQSSSENASIFNESIGATLRSTTTLTAGATLTVDGAHLNLFNSKLVLNSTHNEKINLILTLGAMYEEDSEVLLFTDAGTVEFVMNNITAKKDSDIITLNASDYFTGDWINEKTSLVYDRGTVYVTGVNRVIPESSTATLSLLALAALAARRRRI